MRTACALRRALGAFADASAAATMWLAHYRIEGRVSLQGIIGLACATPVQFWVGRDFYVTAWKALRHRATNMEVLICLGTTVAYVYSVGAFLAMCFLPELDSACAGASYPVDSPRARAQP